MSFEESPSLDDYKSGLPENLPDPSQKTRRTRIALGLLFAVVLFLGAANLLQSSAGSLLLGKGAVQGRVVDAQGNPCVCDVFVIGDARILRAAADGSFLLDGIPAGDQSLVVANAVSGQEYPVKVTAGQTLDVGQLKFLATSTPTR
jgi:hypothetical protein